MLDISSNDTVCYIKATFKVAFFCCGILYSSVKAQYFIEVGGVLSNIKVANKATSVQLVSDNKIGYYLSAGRRYHIDDIWAVRTKVKLSQTGGKVVNSAWLIEQYLPEKWKAYGNAELQIIAYQIGFGGDMEYSCGDVLFYGGVEASAIVYGSFKERNVGKSTSEGEGGTSLVNLNIKESKFNTISLRGNIGIMYHFNSNWFSSFGYNFGITDAVSLSVKSGGWKFQANQSIFHLGGGFMF